MKRSLMIARFPYGGSEYHACANWLVETATRAKADPTVSELHHVEVNDTPITMSRNRVIKQALTQQIDYLLMVDSDMKPDMYAHLGAPRFFDVAWPFALASEKPCVLAAPYCGPPPHENVYVFYWANRESDQPNADLSLEQYTRHDASILTGITEVAALPTGLILIDMRAIPRLPLPWFDYEYTDQYQTHKASTEDVVFTRNLALTGVPQYCTWDCWAGHVKQKVVGKPGPLTASAVSRGLGEAILRRIDHDDVRVEVPDGGVLPRTRKKRGK